MIANYNMVVDFARPSKSNTILVAENDANSRNCNFKLLFDKAPFDMTGVVSASVLGITASGARIYGDAEIKRDEEGNIINELSYLIPLSITENAGNVTMTVTLTDEVGARITSFEFYIKVRNALYDEDDFIDDDDMSGFRDLLARTRAALERMEQMVQEDALPNPYPIRITVDDVEYEYNGEDLVEIFMGKVAYYGEPSGLVDVTEDDSAAAVAVRAAEEAEGYAEDAETKYNEMLDVYNDLQGIIPTARVERDSETHVARVIITDRSGETSVDLADGAPGPQGEQGEKGDKGDKGDPGATGPQGAAGATGPQGEKGDKGDKGDPGATGATGPKGDTGETGPQGPKGDKGDPGTTDADALVKDTVGWTGKNLLKYPYAHTTRTENGITFTDNNNGSITLSGTATAQAKFYFQLKDSSYIPPEGEYCISAEGLTSGISIIIEGYTSAAWVKNIATITSSSPSTDISIDYNGYDRVVAYLTISNGKAISSPITVYPMLRDASITDSTFEPYHESVDVVKANRDEVKDVIGWSGKNLLPNIAASQTINGVTFIVKSDGSITLSGTASANTFMSISDWLDLPSGKYTLNGSASNKVYVFAQKQTSGGVETVAECRVAYPNGVSFDWDNSAKIKGRMVIENGQNVDNITIYPMLRKADISDSTYEPYHASVEQTLRDAEVIEGKNLNVYPYIISHAVNSGITIDIDSEGIITLNGTASSDSNQIIHHRQGYSDNNPTILPAGKYKVIGVGSDLNIELFKTVNGSRTSIVVASAADEYKTFELTETTQIGVLFYWLNGVTFSNRKFGIMIVKDAETDYTFEPYYIPLKDSKFDRAEQSVLGAKNVFSTNKVFSGGELGTVSENGRVIRVKNLSASAWSQYQLYVNVEPHTDYKFTCDVAYTSGKGRIAISNEANTSTFVMSGTLTDDGSIDISFNSSSEHRVIVKFSCALGDSEVGDITYSNSMLRLASDPDDTYVPYAMTNRELTDRITGTHREFTTESLSSIFNIVKENECVLINASGDATAKLTNNALRSVSTGYMVYNSVNNFVEYAITIMSSGELYAGRFNSTDVTNIKKIALTPVI